MKIVKEREPIVYPIYLQVFNQSYKIIKDNKAIIVQHGVKVQLTVSSGLIDAIICDYLNKQAHIYEISKENFMDRLKETNATILSNL